MINFDIWIKQILFNMLLYLIPNLPNVKFYDKFMIMSN